MQRGSIHVNGIQLSYVDYGGQGPGLLLLHGLYGRGTTWADTAKWLTPHFHVVALDQRGHGWSDKPENAYTRDHYVNDAAAFIEAMSLGPAVVIGHSMGALNAWCLAARRPDLVRALVLEDMSPATATPTPGEEHRRWMAEWPMPFPTIAAVRAYFDGLRPGLADYFLEVMVEDLDGYRTLFKPEHMVQSAVDWGQRDYWAELEAVRCPALVVKGEQSDFPREELQEMARRLPQGRYAEVAGAWHVVHYDQPEAWRAVVEPFLVP